MVGRTAELERVLAALQMVLDQRQGRLVMLAGEPGVGKTRLAREVLAQAQARGADGFGGRCFEQHTAVPYVPFGDPLAAALAKAPQDIQIDLRAHWPELAYIVPELGPTPAGRGSHETQLQVFRAAAGLLSALTTLKPFVLVLDDLHWADSTSLSLLLYLSRHLRDTAILILGTYRDVEVGRAHPLAATLRELIRDRLVEEIQVSGLSLAETAELVQSRLSGDLVSQDFITVLHERAQGNPFFTEELLAAVIEQGPVDFRVQSVSLAQVRVPRSIHLVVGERVGRLPAEAQELLSLASVLGQEFDLDLLLAACDRSEADAFAALDAALEARLIADVGDGSMQRYAFVHALIQQTLYEELPTHRRRSLHQRAGQVLKNSRHRAVAAELARHFVNSGDKQQAAAYAVRAGHEATARYAHAEAAHHYTIAVDILRDLEEPVQAAHVQCRLAAELFDLYRQPEALDAYAKALFEFEQRGDHGGMASVHWGLGRVQLGRYDMDAALTHLDTATRLWPDDRDESELSRLLVDTARAKVFGGDRPGAIQVANQALQLAEQRGDAGVIARALVGVAEAQSGDKPDRELIQLMNRAESLARGVADWRTLTRVFIDRAVNRINIGEIQQAVADNRCAVEAADRSGETERLRFAYRALGWHCIPLGAWEEGRSAARRGLSLDPRGTAINAVLAWLEGRYDDAIAHFRTMWSDGRDRGDMQAVAYGLAVSADYMLQLGRAADAEAPAREAADVIRRSWPGIAGWAAPLAETLVCLEAPDAEDVLADAEEFIGETGKAVARPQLMRARGLLLRQRGDLSGAIEILEASAAMARSQQARIELGRTLAVLSEAAHLHGDRALATRSDLERASIVEQIGREVRGLVWARGSTTGTPSRKRTRLGSILTTMPLSPREREVAALIARGLTDRQIAAQLVITEGTAGVHVSHILNKLGYHSRAEIANWATQHGLEAQLEH
jgi:predicted ATPase/DNA-binding CsgD family transcriptional regulator